MISRQLWQLRTVLRKVWVRVVGFAVLALASLGLAQVISPILPERLGLRLGAEAVGQILGVLASSMLAVTTFSLSVAVSAFAAAASNATPRATALLQEDRTTQNVLATFLGAFLFSLVGLIALNADLYDRSGQFVLFLVTILVVALVVVALIRWIGHLMSFGRMGNTLDRVEAAAAASLRRRQETPYLGGVPDGSGPGAGALAVLSQATGYVQHIDMPALQAIAEACDGRVHVLRLPGAFVSRETALVEVAGVETLDDAQRDAIRGAFAVGRERQFDEDPRFGVIVLTEIASRALSPAVNDPGTAISVIGRLVRILTEWRDDSDSEVSFPEVHVPAITRRDIVVDAFRPLARDGAGLIEVQIRLQKALTALCHVAPDLFREAATELSGYALAQAEKAALSADELAMLRRLSPGVGARRGEDAE